MLFSFAHAFLMRTGIFLSPLPTAIGDIAVLRGGLISFILPHSVPAGTALFSHFVRSCLCSLDIGVMTIFMNGDADGLSALLNRSVNLPPCVTSPHHQHLYCRAYTCAPYMHCLHHTLLRAAGRTSLPFLMAAFGNGSRGSRPLAWR
jgi:hypothetical protein